MPIYEYECTQCGSMEEALQKFSEKPLTTCNHCSGKLRKLVSQSSFHLKGTGWYVTDYANKSKAPPSSSTSADSSNEKKASSGTESTKPAKKASSE